MLFAHQPPRMTPYTASVPTAKMNRMPMSRPGAMHEVEVALVLGLLCSNVSTGRRSRAVGRVGTGSGGGVVAPNGTTARASSAVPTATAGASR